MDSGTIRFLVKLGILCAGSFVIGALIGSLWTLGTEMDILSTSLIATVGIALIFMTFGLAPDICLAYVIAFQIGYWLGVWAICASIHHFGATTGSMIVFVVGPMPLVLMLNAGKITHHQHYRTAEIPR